MDIESASELIAYLRDVQIINPTELPSVQILQGGVSNRTVLVEPQSKPAFVIKQALSKLRVTADWYSDPGRIHREAEALRCLVDITPIGTITPLLFEDKDLHIIAMEAVPKGHRNWKEMLQSEGPQEEHVSKFAEILAAIHTTSHLKSEFFRDRFGEWSWFESLRLEPYYEFSASRVNQAKAFYTELLAETRATRLALVHGDYSPKNVLVYGSRFVLLDHEVVHFGDPAFDVGFSLSHLLSKANHSKKNRDRFLSAAILYVDRYRELTRLAHFSDELELRAGRHALGCLLARVVGRSPLEYLSDTEREIQQQAVIRLIEMPSLSLHELIEGFGEEISCQ